MISIMETLHGDTEKLPQNPLSDFSIWRRSIEYRKKVQWDDILAQVNELESNFDFNPDGSEKWQRLISEPIEDQYGQIWMIWKNPAASLSNPKSRYQIYTILQDDMFEDEGDTKNPTIEAYKKFGQAAISTVWSAVKFKYVIVNDASYFDYSRIFKEYSTKTYEFEVGHDKHGTPILLDVILNDDSPPICIYHDQVREYEESLIEKASLGIKHQGREESLKKVFSEKVWQKLGATSIDSLTIVA